MNKQVKHSSQTKSHLMEEEHQGAPGRAHGGIIMKLCDELGGMTAAVHSERPVVTASVDRMSFLSPVYVGETLTIHASVNAVWNTSMEIGLKVEATNQQGETRQTSSAYFTFVALDEQGRPTPVPSLEVETEEEKRRNKEANQRRYFRLEERRLIQESRE